MNKLNLVGPHSQALDAVAAATRGKGKKRRLR